MRIVHYLTWLSRSSGGLLTAVSGLAKATSDLGHDVSMVGGADQHYEADLPIWGGLDIHPHSLRLGSYGLSTAALSSIAALKPDILHINGIWTASSLYGALSALSGTQVVVSPHGMLDPWILARKPAVKAVHATLFERPMLRRAHIHALAEAERQAVGQFMPKALPRTFVIPNGVPPIEASAGRQDRSGTLYLGRLHEKKQTLELIQAWGATAPADHRLTVAGWGSPDYEAAVASAAAQTANVNFVGPLYGDAKEAAFRSARFFILPSLSEGLPMAVLEALQYGCVPIITDQCNLPELFADNVAIRMAADFSDFVPVISDASASTDPARSAVAQAYSQRYLWSSIAARMVAQYQAILTGKGAAA
jgi:glycosyltransferase involved in cell wall biosynthesis